MRQPVFIRWLASGVCLSGIVSNAFAVDAKLATPKSLNPVISYISPSGCLSSGAGFKVSGSNFGSAQSRSLILRTQSGNVPVPVSRWSQQNNIISAKLPSAKELTAGKSFPLLIIDSSTKRILSNRDKLITVCAPQAKTAPTKTPSTTNPAKESKIPAPRQSDSEIDTEPAEQTVRLAPAAGSLIGELPQPTFIPEIKEQQDESYEQKELIVISKNLDAAKQLEATVATEGYRIKRRKILKSLGFVVSVVGLPEGAKVSDVLKQFQRQDSKMLIDANHRYALQASTKNAENNTENNPEKNADNGQSHKLIRWGKANKICGKTIKIGVIDSLVDTSFPGFTANQIVNKSLLPFGIKSADKEHATAIASIIAGQPGSAVIGLLPAAKVYVAGVFRETKDHRTDTTAELIIYGLDWLQSQGVHAINLSIAGPRNLLLEVAIKRLLGQNALIAASVGNDKLQNANIYPAAIDGVVAVTAVDARQRIYQRANRGNFVQVAAPGVDIWAARAGRGPAFMSGTSFATPYVTASLAILRQRYNKKPGQELVSQLITKAKDLGKKGRDSTFGAGLLQFQGCQ